MATDVQEVLNADGITGFRTLNVGYPADDVKDLTPTKDELKRFASNPVDGGVYYYQHNVKKYLASISSGIASTVSEAEFVHRQCPGALLILAGYSQGAMVMHQAELRLASAHRTAVLGHIAGTLLLGDGDRVSRSAAREFGTSSARSRGVRTYLHGNDGKDVAEASATANICDAGDIVCDFGLKTLRAASKSEKVHGSYVRQPGLLSAAADWIAEITARQASARTVLLPDLPDTPGCSGTFAVSASSDARYILLGDCSSALVRYDRFTGAIVSVTTAKYLWTGCGQAMLTDTGKMAAYCTAIGGRTQVAVRDLVSGKLSIASSSATGRPANAAVDAFAISPNGQWLLISSTAGNLVPGVSSDGSHPNIFRKNLKTGAIGLAVKTNGQPDGALTADGISDSGALIAFDGTATNIAGITPPVGFLRDSAYVRDLSTGKVRRLLYQPIGTQSQGSTNVSVSADGTKAAFVGLDGDGFEANVVTCGLSAGLARQPSCKLVASAFPVFDLHLAANGSAVEYSAANTPVSSTTWEIFRVGFSGGTASVMSVNNSGDIANVDTGNSGGIQGISGDGLTVFFSSSATNLHPGGSVNSEHAFVRT